MRNAFKKTTMPDLPPLCGEQCVGMITVIFPINRMITLTAKNGN